MCILLVMRQFTLTVALNFCNAHHGYFNKHMFVEHVKSYFESVDWAKSSPVLASIAGIASSRNLPTLSALSTALIDRYDEATYKAYDFRDASTWISLSSVHTERPADFDSDHKQSYSIEHGLLLQLG